MSDSLVKPLSWWMIDEEDGDYEAITVGGIFRLEAEDGTYHLLSHIYDDHGGSLKSLARGSFDDLKCLAYEYHYADVFKFIDPKPT
jgi:hypothetical protein